MEKKVPLTLDYSSFRQSFFFDGKPFVLKAYNGTQHTLPEGFNSRVITLPMGLSHPLKWPHQEEEARLAKEQGAYLVWELDLGPFSSQDSGQILSFQLALEHFKDTLYPQFEESSIAIILYKGLWEAEQKELLPFFHSLLSVLPDHLLPLFLLENGCTSPGESLRYFSPELLAPFFFASKTPSPYPHLGWNKGNSPLGYFASHPQPEAVSQKIVDAVVIPSFEIEEKWVWEQIATTLQSLTFAYRLIPESLLTQEWEGVERLHLFPEHLGPAGKRAVQGFLATGGEITSLTKACP